jgi:hypothetical protein
VSRGRPKKPEKSCKKLQNHQKMNRKDAEGFHRQFRALPLILLLSHRLLFPVKPQNEQISTGHPYSPSSPLRLNS